MVALLKFAISTYSRLLLSILFVFINGLIGGFIAAAVSLVGIALFLNLRNQLFYLLGIFLLIFIMGDNYKGAFFFFQNLRFLVLGLSLVLLFKYQLFQNNPGNVFIPFTIYAFVVSMALSPIGLGSVLRSLGFWLVAITLFKLIQLFSANARVYTVSFIISILFLFCIVQLSLYFFPVYQDSFLVGRFKGLMANPNGLGLLSLLCYSLIVFFRDYETSFFPRNFLYFLQLTFLFFIVVSGSRTALISVLSFEFLLRVRTSPLVLIISLVVFVGMNVFLSISTSLDFLSSFGLSNTLRTESIATGSGRLEVWQVAYNTFIKDPWIGKGMGYDDYFIDSYSNKFIGENKSRQWNGIWNSYLSMGLNVGLLGMGLYGYAWYRMYQLSSYTVFRFAFLGLCLASAVTESWMAASMNAFMPFVFLIWAFQIYPSNVISKA
ncbi:MAG: hypothetical protein RIQ61_1462 [Bacteroidota bacterium]|jgi:hypothetical protein